MKSLMLFIMLFTSLGAFAVELGEDQKGECISSSQHSRGKSEKVVEVSSEEVQERQSTREK